MFVRQSTYRDAVASLAAWKVRANHWEAKYGSLLKEWNDLVGKVNTLGGLSALKAPTRAGQLSDEDCKRLLMLIHPDKHGGKQSAVEMTQKILAIRDGRA